MMHYTTHHSDTSSIEDLPDEILFDILLRLDIPELHALSLTCHRLRRLATDRYLHEIRLRQYCPTRINSFLRLRPTIYELMCRNVMIPLNARQFDISRKIHRQLITTRLKRGLEQRSTATDLVSRHVLPSTSIAPALVSRSQNLQKEMYRRSLEIKILQRPKPEELRFLGVEYEEERIGVKGLVRRFSCLDSEIESGRRKRRIGMGKESPTRAAVWRLRKFWEKMSMSV